MNDPKTLQQIARNLGLELASKDFDANRLKLAEYINEMLLAGFDQLVNILYRMDVSEKKLRQLLQENPGTDAGLIIADLMIEREGQKIKSRRQSNQRDNNIDENEKW